MLSVGTKVQIKPLGQLLSEGLLEKKGEILINKNDHFILLCNYAAQYGNLNFKLIFCVFFSLHIIYYIKRRVFPFILT